MTEQPTHRLFIHNSKNPELHLQNSRAHTHHCRCDYSNKPCMGLWLSPKISDVFPFTPWQGFCLSNYFATEDVWAHEFELVNSPNLLNTREIHLSEPDSFKMKMKNLMLPLWNDIISKYDGLIHEDGYTHDWRYGWDVDSIVLFEPSKFLKFIQKYQVDYGERGW